MTQRGQPEANGYNQMRWIMPSLHVRAPPAQSRRISPPTLLLLLLHLQLGQHLHRLGSESSGGLRC